MMDERTPPSPAIGVPDFRFPVWLCRALLADARAAIEGKPAAAPYGNTIGGEENPYLRRWFLLPRGDGPSCYLHQFLRDDDDRALHDHPWASCGIILKGGYIEHTPDGMHRRCVGDVILRTPEQRHRVQLLRDVDGRPIDAWTLFLVGQRVRDWGFWCPDAAGADNRFVPWRDFTDGPGGERVGKGCAA